MSGVEFPCHCSTRYMYVRSYCIYCRIARATEKMNICVGNIFSILSLGWMYFPIVYFPQSANAQGGGCDECISGMISDCKIDFVAISLTLFPFPVLCSVCGVWYLAKSRTHCNHTQLVQMRQMFMHALATHSRHHSVFAAIYNRARSCH